MLPLINAYVTSAYNLDISKGRIHKGIDIISKNRDKNIKAVKSGFVSFVGYDKNGFGNYISIQDEEGYRALYCHLKSINVKKGDKIFEGQIIGIEGTTGNSTGIHLHFEVRKSPYKKEDYIDPAKYLKIKNKVGYVEIIEESEEKIIKDIFEKLLEEFGREILEKSFKNICLKEKNKKVIPEWGKEDLEKAIEAGITDGTNPQTLASRIETIVMIQRALDKKNK